MDRTTDVAFALGRRVRSARLRIGLTQAALASRAGISSSAVSRLELGDAANAPLSTWIAVTEAVGIDILSTEPDRSAGYLTNLFGLAGLGGWVPGAREGSIAWLERPARPSGLGRAILAPERVAVSVIPVLTDARVEFDRLRHLVAVDVARGRSGVARAGVLVVVRSAANIRSAKGPWRRSSPGRMRCLTSPDVPIPGRSGVVWLERRGTHLVPGV